MAHNTGTSDSHWEEFYATHLPPVDYEDNRSLLKEFCDRHNKIKNNIVLVTVSITYVLPLIQGVLSFALIYFVFQYFSRAEQQYPLNTTPYVLWIISVLVLEVPHLLNTFLNMVML